MEIIKSFLENKKLVKKFFWILWFLSLLSLLAWILFDMGIRFNTTSSLPRGLYIIKSGSLSRGDFATFCIESEEVALLAFERGYLQTGNCSSGVQPLLKLVAGLPGDSIVQSNDGIIINGDLWQNSKAKVIDSKERCLYTAKLPAIIPNNMVLMLSNEHDGSFDSRYFGLVPIGSVRKVKQLLTY